MMVPFDNSMPSQQQQGVSQQPLPRPPIPPGHQSAPSSGIHQQAMNAAYPHGMHRNVSAGMPQGGQYQIPPQSPGSRHNSFTMPAGGGPQGQFSSHPPLNSPAHQQQQGGAMHPNVTQMHRGSSQSRPGHMGMPSIQQPHDSMMPSSSGGHGQQYMGNSMDNTMNNTMNNNSMMGMGNSMNMNMGNSLNGAMPNMGGSVNSTMGNNSMNMGNSGTSAMSNSSNNAMNNSMNSNSGLNGNWQTERDTQHRRDMIQHM